MTDYAETVATLLGEGLTNSALAEELLRRRRAGTLEIPEAVLFVIEWINIMLAQASDDGARRAYRALFDREDVNWFDEPKTRRLMRRFLQSESYGLKPGEIETFVDARGQAKGLLRSFTALFSNRDKIATLRSLHVIDDAGRWSERGYQRLADLMDDLDAETHHLPAGLEILRWELHRQHYPDRPMCFAHALMNDFLAEPVILRAHRIARIGLEQEDTLKLPRMETMLTPGQINRLRRIGAWIHGAHFMETSPALAWIGLMASESGINWKRFRDITAFIRPKFDQTPDPELIRDWLGGLVTFEGIGVIRDRMKRR